jgi:hypothetical protein
MKRKFSFGTSRRLLNNRSIHMPFGARGENSQVLLTSNQTFNWMTSTILQAVKDFKDDKATKFRHYTV